MKYIATNKATGEIIYIEAADNGKAVERLENVIKRKYPDEKNTNLTNHSGTYDVNASMNAELAKGFVLGIQVGV